MLMLAIIFALTGAALGFEVQGARPGPGKRLCCREPFPDELRILLLAASAGAGNAYDSHGASDWVSIEYRYTA